MRNIAAITMKELRTYFRTPIAYVIIALFLTVTGWFFFFGSKFFMRGEAEMRAFFEPLPWIFLLFIPAITMRLWSEEKKGGTIEVLFTLPVRSYEAVLGKFFGAVILLAIMLALSFAIPAIVSYVGDPDPGPIWGGYIGALLLGSAYIALGLFASGLTENQIIAFIAAVVMGFFFFILDNTGLENVFPAFIKKLSLNYHFESVGRGVLDLRDMVYYMSFIGFFLILNASLLRGLRQSAAVTIGLAAALLVLLNLAVSPVRARLDLTEARLYTLHQDTKNLLGRVDDDLNVRVYMTPAEDMPPEFASLPRDIRDSLDEFKAFSNGRLKIKFVNTSASEEAKREAEKAGIPPQKATVFGASELVQKEVFLGAVVEYGDRSEVLPGIDPRTIEYDLDVAISKVTRTKQPQIAFNVTSSIPDNIPPQFRAQLQAQNPNQDKHDVNGDYEIPYRVIQSQFGQKNVRTVKLDEPVPPEVETLIVANSAGIDDTAQFYMDQFLMRGGRLMVLVDGANVDMATLRGMPTDGKLDSFFSHYGFKIAKDIVLDEECATARIPGQRRGMLQFYQAVPYPAWIMATDIAQTHPITRGFKQLLLPYSSSIELSAPAGVDGNVLVQSSPKAWKQENTFFLSPEPEIKPPADGKGMMQFPLVGLLSGKWKSFYADHPLPESLAPKTPETGAIPADAGKDPAAQAKEKPAGSEPGKPADSPSKSDGGSESKPDGGNAKPDDGSAKPPVGGGPRVQEQDVPGGGVVAQETPPAQTPPAPAPPAEKPAEKNEQQDGKADPQSGEPTSPLVLPGDEKPVTPEVKPEKKPVDVIKESQEPSTILVIGNSNFISGQYAEQNAQFFLNATEYLTVGGELLGVRSRQTPSRKFEKPDTAKINLLNYVGTGLVPALTVLFGFLFYIYRRNVRRAKVSL